MIKTTQIHCGQYQRYGDFFRVWEIETDTPLKLEAVAAYCFTYLYSEDLPTEAEWRAAIRIPDGAHCQDPSYYFRGYYKVEEIDENKYKFTVCEPYAD